MLPQDGRGLGRLRRIEQILQALAQKLAHARLLRGKIVEHIIGCAEDANARGFHPLRRQDLGRGTERTLKVPHLLLAEKVDPLCLLEPGGVPARGLPEEKGVVQRNVVKAAVIVTGHRDGKGLGLHLTFKGGGIGKGGRGEREQQYRCQQ